MPTKTKPLPPEARAVLDAWQHHFPEKMQPQRRPGNSVIRKLRTRLKDPDWARAAIPAIERAAGSDHLHASGWFQFEFVVRNDANVHKMAAGWLEWIDRRDAKDLAAKRKAQAQVRREQLRAEALTEYKRQAVTASDEDRARLLDKVDREFGRDAWFELLTHIQSIGEQP